MLIDDAAIGTDQDKKFVLVVDKDNHVRIAKSSVGGMQGNLRVVTDGLKPGERIVVNGLQRVRPGDTVRAHMVPMTTDRWTEQRAARTDPREGRQEFVSIARRGTMRGACSNV